MHSAEQASLIYQELDTCLIAYLKWFGKRKKAKRTLFSTLTFFLFVLKLVVVFGSFFGCFSEGGKVFHEKYVTDNLADFDELQTAKSFQLLENAKGNKNLDELYRVFNTFRTLPLPVPALEKFSVWQINLRLSKGVAEPAILEMSPKKRDNLQLPKFFPGAPTSTSHSTLAKIRLMKNSNLGKDLRSGTMSKRIFTWLEKGGENLQRLAVKVLMEFSVIFSTKKDSQLERKLKQFRTKPQGVSGLSYP